MHVDEGGKVMQIYLYTYVGSYLATGLYECVFYVTYIPEVQRSLYATPMQRHNYYVYNIIPPPN